MSKNQNFNIVLEGVEQDDTGTSALSGLFRLAVFC